MALYMKYGSTKGDVSTQGYADHIELQSFAFSISRGVKMTVGQLANRESTIPILSDISISKLLDSSSPDLIKAAFSGKAETKADIFFVTTDGESGGKTYLQHTIYDVILSSFSEGGSSFDRAQEGYTLSYTKIDTKITPYDKDNKAGTAVVVSFDLKTGKTG